MATKKAQSVDVLALFQALGVTPEQVAQAIGAANVQAAQHRDIKVEILTGEATKYGAVGIFKGNGNGRFLPKVGVRREALDQLIADLQAARKELG